MLDDVGRMRNQPRRQHLAGGQRGPSTPSRLAATATSCRPSSQHRPRPHVPSDRKPGSKRGLFGEQLNLLMRYLELTRRLCPGFTLAILWLIRKDGDRYFALPSDPGGSTA
jgi:hypothetical protein